MTHGRPRAAQPAAADDLDVLEVIGEKRELQRSWRVGFVAGDQTLYAADE